MSDRSALGLYALWLVLMGLFVWVASSPGGGYFFAVIASWSVARWLWNQKHDQGEA